MKIYDVVIVGGGFAGVAAGIAAAREGTIVLLIERYGFLGGAANFHTFVSSHFCDTLLFTTLNKEYIKIFIHSPQTYKI